MCRSPRSLLAPAMLLLGLWLPAAAGAEPEPGSLPGPVLAPASGPAPDRGTRLEGVTFAVDPDVVYIPLGEAANALGWRFTWEPKTSTGSLKEKPLPESVLRRLGDGTVVLPVRLLSELGAEVDRDAAHDTIRVSDGDRSFVACTGEKRVEVDIARQQMRAWQGDRLLLVTPVSTGRQGYVTPTGYFAAGAKEPMHLSTRYGNAEMPWSVQIAGDVFIHGSKSVPPRAASHGCVRLPLTGANPAKWFYDWVEDGVIVQIFDLPTAGPVSETVAARSGGASATRGRRATLAPVPAGRGGSRERPRSIRR